MGILESLRQVGFIGFLDIALMALLIYAVLVLFKKKRATFILTGILLSAVFYLIAYQLNLSLMTTVLRAFFAVILLAMIVIFKEELRDLFEEIALWSTRRRLKYSKKSILSRPEVEILVRTLSDLAREKIGALIVLKGKQSILRYLEGGVELDGKLSEALLKSLFDPHSMGHDGAVYVQEGRVAQFGCHLPLSNNFALLSRRGTRHAAALGLSEICDALSLVVSEERGIISIAQEGKLFEVKEAKGLEKTLEKFFDQLAPRRKHKGVIDFFKKNYREKIIALVTALALWFFFVHESSLVFENYEVDIAYPELENNLVVEEVTPPKVEVTFSGPRNAFHLVGKKDIRVRIKLAGAKPGKNNIRINETNLSYPKNLVLENIQPQSISVRIIKKEPDKS